MAASPLNPRLWKSSVLGIEVGPTHLRAYRGPGRDGDAEAMEVKWGTSPPPGSVEALRERYGTGNVLAVALEMSVVYAKRLELPPLSLEERRRILAMDPRRYFPVREQSLVAGVRHDDLVVATPRETFDRWVESLGSLGSVERVEPAPAALVRHLAASGSPAGVLVLREADGTGTTLATMRDGRIETLRKVSAAAEELPDLIIPLVEEFGPCALYPSDEELAGELARRGGRDRTVTSFPAPPGAPTSFAGARGALLGREGGAELTLVSPELERRLVRLSRRRSGLAAGALGVGLVLLGWSMDHRRSAVLETLEREVARATSDAEPVLEVRDRAEALTEQLGQVGEAARARSNPLEVLEALTRALPADAHLTRLSASGREWEVNGRARDAARLIGLLEARQDLADVRFRTATTRVRVGDEELENFTLVFRHVPPT